MRIILEYPDGETDQEKVQPGVRCEELIKIATSEVSDHGVTLTDDLVLTLERFDKATNQWKEIADPLNLEKKETLRVIVKKVYLFFVNFEPFSCHPWDQAKCFGQWGIINTSKWPHAFRGSRSV